MMDDEMLKFQLISNRNAENTDDTEECHMGGKRSGKISMNIGQCGKR
jgi:hypothetical protein